MADLDCSIKDSEDSDVPMGSVEIVSSVSICFNCFQQGNYYSTQASHAKSQMKVSKNQIN